MPMEDIEARSESAARLEGERSCSKTAMETGIARALIASEKKPQPVEEWLEKKINDKTFKVGRTLDSETQDQMANQRGKKVGDQRRNTKTPCSRPHQGDPISRMARQCRSGHEE